MAGLLSNDDAFPLLVLSALAYILFQDAVREWVDTFALQDRVVLLLFVMAMLYIAMIFFQRGGDDL